MLHVATDVVYENRGLLLQLFDYRKEANLVTALTVAFATKPQTPWAERVQATGLYPRAVVPACGILEVSNHGRLLGKPGVPRWVDDRIVDVCEGYLGGVGEGTLADPLVILETLAKGEGERKGRRGESGLQATPQEPPRRAAQPSGPLTGRTDIQQERNP